mgnify:CR=1 FL=1
MEGTLDLKRFQGLLKHTDIVIAFGVVVVLFFMILPIPPMIMDIALSFNITLALVILLTTTYVKEPLELSSFPSILLLTTLLRLGLNVASTRLILLRGEEGITAAGKVIASFGGFVVGGNYAVGIVVFIILITINLIVITRGAGRIAEVAARFTLDGMPGKQMSIDADLSSGLITEEEARARRQRINLEAEYYGAMDGASKFVRGDAVAGILITFVNIIGGLLIGVFQKSMPLEQALSTYTILTIGDGLVSQIPALIISTSVGILVSKGGTTDANLSKEMTMQVFSKPKALGIASAILGFLGLIPGLPTIPFFILSISSGLAAYGLKQAKLEEEKKKEEIQIAQKRKKKDQPRSESLTLLDPISLELGYGLIPLVEKGLEGTGLVERVKALRKQITQDLGLTVPPVHIQDNLELKPNEYRILLKGAEMAKAEIYPNYLLAMETPHLKGKVEGIPTKEPTYGLPGVWIRKEEKERAITLGYTVVDPTTVIITHLSHIIKSYGHELLGRQEVQQILDTVKTNYPKLVEELVPSVLSLGAVGKVLRNLLREQVPIRDIITILETLADYGNITKDPDLLTEFVRQALNRTITKQHQAPDGYVYVLTLDQSAENAILSSLQQTEQGTFIALDPRLMEGIMDSINRNLPKLMNIDQQPAIICSPRSRPFLKRLIERFIPNLDVISYNEISPQVQIRSLGIVGLGNAD